MNYLEFHLMKMRELQQYRQDRKKADLIANISVIVILLFMGLAIYGRLLWS